MLCILYLRGTYKLEWENRKEEELSNYIIKKPHDLMPRN